MESKVKARAFLCIDLTQEQLRSIKGQAKRKHQHFQNYLARRIDERMVHGLHVDALFIEKPDFMF